MSANASRKKKPRVSVPEIETLPLQVPFEAQPESSFVRLVEQTRIHRAARLKVAVDVVDPLVQAFRSMKSAQAKVGMFLVAHGLPTPGDEIDVTGQLWYPDTGVDPGDPAFQTTLDIEIHADGTVVLSGQTDDVRTLSLRGQEIEDHANEIMARVLLTMLGEAPSFEV